ncbi:MAG: ROK family transcriptional regulator [Anaerolineae bacterium]|jgi:glucokinase-like ROK family protein
MTIQQTLLGSGVYDIKAHNTRAVLLALLRYEPVSRVRLAELTGLSSTTITNLISELLEHGIVAEEDMEKPKRRRKVGRPPSALRLVPEARYAVGIHIGVGSVRVGIADLRARLQSHLTQAHPLEKPPEEVLTETAALVDNAISESGVNPQQVVGIGVGASGLVNPQTGLNVFAPNLGWRDVPIGDWFTARLGIPVCVDNNVRAMALGEALFGAGQDVRALAFVYARIGVGAGFVVDGELYRGGGAGAGEIGHTTILPDGGKLCRCGNTGCLETLVSEPAIVRLAVEMARHDGQSIPSAEPSYEEGGIIERIFDAARAGDKATRAMLNERARYMGIALANLVNTFNPELILLGGVLAQGQDLLLPMIEATMRQRAFANLGRQVRLETTSFGRQAGTVGAAALALNTFFYQQPETV